MTTIASLLKRVERIEAKQATGRITALFGARTFTEDEAVDAVANWRQWVKDGRASRIGDTLLIRAPKLTVEEWTAQHVPREWPLH